MFFLFGGLRYYPLGGMGDFKGVYATIEEAKAAHDSEWARIAARRDGSTDWGQIAVLCDGTLKVIAENKMTLGAKWEPLRKWKKVNDA